MSNYSVWLDHQHAYVYKFDATGMEEMTFKSDFYGGSKENHQADEKLFHKIAGKLVNADEVAIFGPGTAKDQFKHHCENHHHDKLAKAIVGVKAMEAHPTKAMMLKESSDFFKHLHMWTKNY